MTKHRLICADSLVWMRNQPTDSVDTVVTSPPYEDCRYYGQPERYKKLKGQAWVDWIIEYVVEAVRISKGLVVFVVEGKTRNYSWSGTPALLMADLIRCGVTLRKPPIYKRVGIPGSGGPDWWRNDYEFCLCATKGGRFTWSDNTATGLPCKYGPGGVPSHRVADGTRVNERKMRELVSNGSSQRGAARQVGLPFKTSTSGIRAGDLETVDTYIPPELANPGNVIECSVGGGKMGSDIAHETEAPFPEQIAVPFIKCFCPQGGIVLDPFCGSSTTGAVAILNNRYYIGIDNRKDQITLSRRRLEEAIQRKKGIQHARA